MEITCSWRWEKDIWWRVHLGRQIEFNAQTLGEQLSRDRGHRESRPDDWKTQLCWAKKLAGHKFTKKVIGNKSDKSIEMQ